MTHSRPAICLRLLTDTPGLGGGGGWGVGGAQVDSVRQVCETVTPTLMSDIPLSDDRVSVFISLSIILPAAICQPAQTGSEGLRCHMSPRVCGSMERRRVLIDEAQHGRAAGGVADTAADDISESL